MKVLFFILGILLIYSGSAFAQSEAACKERARQFITDLGNPAYKADAYLKSEEQHSSEAIAAQLNLLIDRFEKNEIENPKRQFQRQQDKNVNKGKSAADPRALIARANMAQQKLNNAKKKADFEKNCPRLIYSDRGILQSLELDEKERRILQRNAQRMLVPPLDQTPLAPGQAKPQAVD